MIKNNIFKWESFYFFRSVHTLCRRFLSFVLRIRNDSTSNLMFKLLPAKKNSNHIETWLYKRFNWSLETFWTWPSNLTDSESILSYTLYSMKITQWKQNFMVFWFPKDFTFILSWTSTSLKSLGIDKYSNIMNDNCWKKVKIFNSRLIITELKNFINFIWVGIWTRVILFLESSWLMWYEYAEFRDYTITIELS